MFKKAKKAVIMVAILQLILFGFASCAVKIRNVYYDRDILTPIEVETPGNTSGAPKLPTAPLYKPDVNTEVPPAVVSYRAEGAYNVEEKLNGDVVISFDNDEEELEDWSYVYIEIMDFSAEYSNIKLLFDSEGVESVVVQAVYYEQYADGLPAVTVLNEAVVNGENILAAPFADLLVLNKAYNPVAGQYLKSKTILGFMVFIDSNPKLALSDRTGTLTLHAFGVVDKDDPDLAILNSPPRIINFTSYGYGGTPVLTNSANVAKTKDLTFEYNVEGAFPFIAADIQGYKSEYTGLRMKIRTQGAVSISYGIQYTLGTSAVNYTWFDGAYDTKAPNGDIFEELEFDFTTLEEMSEDYITPISGSFVRFLRPNQLLFYVDSYIGSQNSGKIEIKDIEFFVLSDEGAPKVMGNFMVGANGIAKSNVNPGGFATISYDTAQGWSNVSVGVSSFKAEYSILEVKVKFYGANNLGIALAYGGGNHVIMQSHWNGAGVANVVKTVTSETGSDALGSFIYYVFTLDFTEAKGTDVQQTRLKDRPISSIYFYIDAVDDEGNELKGDFDSTRIMQFVGIEFKAKI